MTTKFAIKKLQRASITRRVSDSETRQYNVSHQHEMSLA